MSTFPEKPGDLFLAVTTAAGTVHTTIRDPTTGAWSPFEAISAFSQVKNVEVSGHFGCLCTLDNDPSGQVWFSSWFGDWLPAQRLGAGLAPFAAQAGAGDTRLALIGTAEPTLTNWSFSLPLCIFKNNIFGIVRDQLNGVRPGDLTRADSPRALAVEGLFGRPDPDFYQLCLATKAGGLFYTQHDNSGRRQRFVNVKTASGDPGPVSNVSCSSAPDGFHIGVATESGGIYHTSVNRDSSQWPPFENVTSRLGSTAKFVRVTVSAFVAHFGQQDWILHLVGVTAAGGLLHTIRRPDGTWQPFLDIKAQAGDPGIVTSLCSQVTPVVIG